MPSTGPGPSTKAHEKKDRQKQKQLKRPSPRRNVGGISPCFRGGDIEEGRMSFNCTIYNGVSSVMCPLSCNLLTFAAFASIFGLSFLTVSTGLTHEHLVGTGAECRVFRILESLDYRLQRTYLHRFRQLSKKRMTEVSPGSVPWTRSAGGSLSPSVMSTKRSISATWHLDLQPRLWILEFRRWACRLRQRGNVNPNSDPTKRFRLPSSDVTKRFGNRTSATRSGRNRTKNVTADKQAVFLPPATKSAYFIIRVEGDPPFLYLPPHVLTRVGTHEHLYVRRPDSGCPPRAYKRFEATLKGEPPRRARHVPRSHRAHAWRSLESANVGVPAQRATFRTPFGFRRKEEKGQKKKKKRKVVEGREESDVRGVRSNPIRPRGTGHRRKWTDEESYRFVRIRRGRWVGRTDCVATLWGPAGGCVIVWCGGQIRLRLRK
ncbi:hypothetical protein H6P81_004642 [Aristolochia fimbriata]|uniref:Uncharacterized protein n=1 Tax=Aristolochia fimbriata TaxID=158543 RepID=A0AAV7ESQ9_ARIFI|nr:hypothetical protein H6P81_004642 [Aristolochia fimbriata]